MADFVQINVTRNAPLWLRIRQHLVPVIGITADHDHAIVSRCDADCSIDIPDPWWRNILLFAGRPRDIQRGQHLLVGSSAIGDSDVGGTGLIHLTCFL